MKRHFCSKWLILVFLPAMLLFSAVLPVSEPAEASSVNKSSAIDIFYDNLARDPAGKAAVENARAGLYSLSKDPSAQPWADVLGNPYYGLYNEKVKDLFGGDEHIAKQNVVEFIFCLESILYTTDSDTQRNNIANFRQSQAVQSILGSDQLVNQLCDCLDGTQKNVPGAIMQDISALVGLASGDQTWRTNGKFSKLQKRLRAIDWSIGRLVSAVQRVGAEVDPGYKGEFALIKAYMLSVSSKKGNH